MSQAAPQQLPVNLNKTHTVLVTYKDGVKEYRQVRGVSVNPGLVVLQWRDREVLVPITSDVRDIEITEDQVLS